MLTEDVVDLFSVEDFVLEASDLCDDTVSIDSVTMSMVGR